MEIRCKFCILSGCIFRLFVLTDLRLSIEQLLCKILTFSDVKQSYRINNLNIAKYRPKLSNYLKNIKRLNVPGKNIFSNFIKCIQNCITMYVACSQ